MEYRFSTMVFVLLSCNIFSQNVEYGGSVKDYSDKEYLIILTNVNTPEVSFTESTQSQKFIFKNIPIGKYNRCATTNLIAKCDTILIKENNYNDIIEINKEKKIAEVVVSNKKPLIQNKNGVLGINVESSPILSNGNAFETVSKLPGVSYTPSNNSLKIKGKAGVQIQIDGQILYMSTNEAMNYLKNISSSDISEIEITSSPSAKNDASGTAGIINIKTKRLKREGYYIAASLYGTQGKYYKQNAGIRGQYNTKKSRYMLYYGNSYNNNFEKASIDRSFNNASTLQDTYAKIKGKNNTINAQYEHKFKNSNLLINSSFSFYNENIGQNTGLNFYNSQNTLTSTLLSRQDSKNKANTLDLGAKYVINNKKSTLTLKNNYIAYDIDNRSLLLSKQIPTIVNYEALQNISPNRINMSISQADYEVKIDSLSKIETGAKAIFQNIKSENNFYEASVFDTGKSNKFKYNEWIFGGYAQYSKTLNDKINFSAGSRLEYNPLKGIDEYNNYEIKREYLNLFPFFNIAYAMNNNNNFNISYSKRINRPRFKNLMPFIYYVDRNTRIMGNPELRPSISHNIDLQYILKNKYIFSLSYENNENHIYQTPVYDNSNSSTVLTPKNIKKSSLISFSSNASVKPFKWWNMNVNALLIYRNIQDPDIQINSKNLSGQIVASNVFSLPKGIKFEFTTEYTTPFIQGSYKIHSLFSANIGITKAFLKNKLLVSLVGNDIFKTYTIKNTSIIKNQPAYIVQNIDTHWIRLGVVYRLSKGIKKNNAGEDELSREIKSRAK